MGTEGVCVALVVGLVCGFGLLGCLVAGLGLVGGFLGVVAWWWVFAYSRSLAHLAGSACGPAPRLPCHLRVAVSRFMRALGECLVWFGWWGGVGGGVFGPLAYSQCAPAVDISLFSLLETDSNWHFAGPFCLAFPRRFGVCVVVWFVGLLLFGWLFLWRR